MDRHRILIVDDEIRMCESLETLLSGQGFEIACFTDGRQALSYLEDHGCDLVLLDLMMPAMDGFTVLKQIKENAPDVQVIMMTAQGSADCAVKAMKQGAYDFLCKPFEMDELIQRIQNTLHAQYLSKQNALIEAKLAMAEAQFRQAQKMEAVGTLAGGIAHDFNNLLTGIQGLTSLMLLHLDPSHPHYKGLKSIQEQVESGANLTRQMLGFARGGRYDVKPADINDIVKKTAVMFGRTTKDIFIHQKYGKDLSAVEVDPGQMEQVFMNLYVNAWQAMPEGGAIYLTTEHIVLADEPGRPYAVKPGKYVRIVVTDTGIGMDEETKARIFEPFFTTKGMGRGTGLGLATVYGIIKGHNGMIDVESRPSHGTTFNICLPASEKQVAEEKAVAETIAGGTETILLVDDEKMVLEVCKLQLESQGYRIYEAGNGRQAISIFREKEAEIDLVLLDMIMPGISGGETFDRLREIKPEVKVLLSSGYCIEGQARKILDRGCNGFLQKPFRIEDLSRKVRETLD